MIKLWLKQSFLTVASVLCATFGSTSGARAERDIVYSARYYLKPNVPSQRAVNSHYHLYRINADGLGKVQITFGAHDDGLPVWSPNGRRIAFFRNGTLCLCNAEGRQIVKLLDLSQFSWYALRWSPDGKTLGIIHDFASGNLSNEVLYLIDVRTRKTRRIADIEHYAWSPDSRKVIVEGGAAGVRVLDWRTQQQKKLLVEAANLAWFAPNSIATTGVADDNGIKELLVFDANGNVLRRLPIAKNKDGDYADWRSTVQPIPRTSQAFTLLSDISTSSGHEAVAFRVSSLTGKRMRLADGQFFRWAPDGQRFLNVSYHDTPPYDTLPNGHKRVVYTTKLQVGTSEKNLRDLVSGLVYVDSADWRALPH